jgi:hypothetical protein
MEHAGVVSSSNRPDRRMWKGAANAFRCMVLRTGGLPGCKPNGSLASFSGEPIFRKDIYEEFRKLGGPETLVALGLRRGRVRDAAKEEGVRR